MSDNTHLVVCMAVKKFKHIPVFGSVKKSCAVCTELVWVSPSVRALITVTPKASIQCVDCSNDAIAAAKELEFVVAPGQENELRQAMEVIRKSERNNGRSH